MLSHDTHKPISDLTTYGVHFADNKRNVNMPPKKKKKKNVVPLEDRFVSGK